MLKGKEGMGKKKKKEDECKGHCSGRTSENGRCWGGGWSQAGTDCIR